MADGAFNRATAVRESSHFKEIIKTRTGEREEIHKKTFTKWINAKLSKASPPLQISHLIEDLQDGLALLLLLEVLVPGLTLPKEKGKLRIHKMNNVTRAFEVLTKHGVKLVGISNSDIVDCKTTPILGLIWSIILRFQVQDVMQDTSGSSVKDFHVEKKLLGWCNLSLEGYEHAVKLKDFTVSWRNGLAFNAIIHAHKPELFSFEDLRQNDNRTNLEHAFTVANENLAVPRLLEPEDIDVAQPDKKLIIMYLTSLYDGLQGYVPQGKRRKLEHLAEMEAYRSCHGDVMLYISQVESDIASKLDSSNRYETPNEEYKKSKELINNIANHRGRVQEVIDRGSALIKGRRLTEVEAKEINDQLVTLQDRWEKLSLLAERLNKRCHSALIGPKEQKMDDQLAWILQARENLAREDVPSSPRDLPLKTRISELTALIGEIEKKQPEIEQTVDEVGRLCADVSLDEEDTILLRNKLEEVSRNWEELRREALEKQIRLDSAPEYDAPLHGAKRIRLAEEDLIHIEDGSAVNVEGALGPSDISPLDDSIDGQPRSDRARLQEDQINPYMFKPIVVNLNMDDGDSSVSPRSTPPHPQVEEMIQAVDDQGVVEANPEGGYALQLEELPSLRATPEIEKRKRDKLLKWKMNRKKLLDTVKDCELKMKNTKPKDAEEDPQRVKEYQDVLEECDSDVRGVEPDMRFVFEYGNDLMADEDFDGEEREHIMTDLEHVIHEYNTLKEELERELKHRPTGQEDSNKDEHIQQWKKDCVELDDKLCDFQDILNGMKNKEIPRDAERFAGYTAEVAEFTEEIQALEPQFVQVMNDGNQLLREQALDEPEKARIYAEMQEIESKYEGVKDNISQEMNRLEEIEKKEELDTWNKWKKKLEEQFDGLRDQLKTLKDHEQPNELQTAEELLALSKECSSMLESSEPEVCMALDYSDQVLGDDLLNPDEKHCIEEDVDQLKRNIDELKRDSAETQKRLEDRVAELDRDKNSKLDEWNDIKAKTVASIDLCRTQFEQAKTKGPPRSPKDVRERVEAVKECSAELQLAFPEVNAGYEYGNTLLEDNNLDPISKENIQKDMETVGSDFKNLQKSIEDEQKSLEELQEEYDKEIQNQERIDEWRDERNKLNSFLKKCRAKHNQLRGLDMSGDPAKVRDKLERLKGFSNEIREVSPVLETGLEFGDTLLADPLLREDDKSLVRDDVTKIRGGFESLKSEVFEEQNRLEELAREQEAEKIAKLDRWNTSNENAKHVIDNLQEKVLDLKSNNAPQSNAELEARAQLMKDCEKEVECCRPELNSALDSGKELIYDSILDDSERDQVKHELNQLEKQLSNVDRQMADEQGRLEIATLQQAKERQEKLDRWEKWGEKIKGIMGNCRDKLEPLTAKDSPRTRRGLEEDLARVQECEDGLVSSEAEVDFGLDYGSQLLDDHVLADKDKSTVGLEIDQLKFELNELKRRMSYEKDRINMETERQDEQSRDKLDEWDEWKMEIRNVLDKLKDRFSSMSRENPKNRIELDEQMIEMKECVDELESTEPEIRSYLEKGYQLVNNDDTLSEEAKGDIERDIDQTEDELKSMARQTEDRQLHLQGVLDNLAEEEEAMGEWRERARMVRYGLTVADNIVPRGKPDPPQSKTQLEDKLREIQGINQGFVENEGDFESTLRLGRELVTDDVLSEESIKEVKADLVFMDDNWHKLKEQCLDEEKRLGTALQLYEVRGEEVDTWHQRCDNLHYWIRNKLEAQKIHSLSPVPSFGNVKRQQSVNEDLLSGLLERQDMINYLIDDGNRFIDDDLIPMDDRENLHDKMSKLHDDWDELTDLVQERQRIAIEQKLKLEQSHQDEIEGWRKRINRIVKWIGEAEPKINKQFAIAPDLDTVKKQKENIQLFTTEMLSHQLEVSGLLQDGDRLAKDEDLGEEERASISKENLDFGHRWEELEELITWKQNRLEDTISKLKKQQHDKLAKWDEGLQDVSGWVEGMEPLIEPEPRLASDVDSAYQQLEEMQHTVQEAPLYQEKVNSLNEFSSNLMTDPCLGEEERVKLRRETVQCNEKWNEFVNIANARQARLDQNIDRLESEQNASLDQWKAKYTRSSNLLDQFEAGIPILDQPVGNRMEDVKRQEEHFEAFSDEVDANETHVNETCKLGERIKNEEAFSRNVRDTVEGQLNLVRVRWDRVKDFLVLRKGRLEEASKRLGKDRQDKLLNWEDKRDEIDKMMDGAEQEAAMQEVIEDDLPTVRKQSEELQEAIGEIMDNHQKVVEFGKHSDALMSDNSRDNSSKNNIQKEKELRIQRWNAIVDKTNKHQARLQERLRDLEVGQAGMSRWLDQLIILQEKVDKLHQVCDSDLGPDYEAMLIQKKETENAILESQAIEPQIAEFINQSDELKSGPGLNANQQDKVTRESRELNKRWGDLNNSLNSRQSSIDIVFKDLEKEQHHLLDEWKSLSGNTRKWLKDTTARVQAQDSPTPDLDHARAQKQEMEDLFGEMRQYEPNINALDGVGAKLLKNPSLRGPERERVANDRAAVMRDWDRLNSEAQDMQSKLDGEVEGLERDQREKLRIWENKTDPLEVWLNETEAEVESYEPIGFDLETVRAQKDQAQNMINELLHEQPRFAEVRDYGNTLTTEPCVGLEERMVLQERMQSLNEKWDDVYGKVTKRHDRILEVLKPLEEEKKRKEEEQRRKVEELRRRREEEERKRREEEERLRKEEEERKKREEEERRKRAEEEEQRRKEAEERKRLEEEERKRREEEEQASKEELMALMMDFQPHVEKLEKERQVFASPDEATLVPVVDDVVESSQVSFVKSDPFEEAQERTHERVVAWREEVNGINRWLDSHRSKLDDESDDEDLVGLREHQKLTEGMERDLPVYKGLYEDASTVYSQELLDDPYISEDDLKTVEEDMSKLRNKWERTIRTKEKKLYRLDDKIRSKEKELTDEMERSETNINHTKKWIDDKLQEIDSLGPVGDDMQTISQQKAKLKDISQEIVDFEPTFVESTEACYNVSRDAALTPDESHQLQCSAEDCEDRWDDLNGSVRKKVDEILARTTELQQHQQGFLQEWSDKHETFEANIKNCEDKYKKNTPQGNDAIAMGLEGSERQTTSQNNGNVDWKAAIDSGQDKLRRARKSLMDIRNRKKNRKWSLLDTIKDTVSSIGKRLRRSTRPQGINLDQLVEHVEKHEELMQRTSELQKPASEVFAVGDGIRSSPAVDDENKESVEADLAALRTRWNAFNEQSFSRAQRLENLAQQIESEYEKFDSWHDKCGNLNKWLCESERLIKLEEKASTDVETVKNQIIDNKNFLTEVRDYEPQAEEFFEECRDLMESSRLDKADVEGIEKTRDTLRTRWNAVNEHLRDRQNRLEGMLLVLQKKNTEDTLGRWKNQSSQLKLWLSSSDDKLSRGNLDETDFGAIEEYATQVEDVESALQSSYNSELNLLTDAGFEILKKEGLNSSEQGEVTEELNSLNQHIGKLESSARLKKGKIRDASAKHFDRNLFELESSVDELEREAKQNFSFVGSDIMEVKKQLADVQNFENELAEERRRFAEDKEKFEDCKRKNLLNDDDCDKLEQRFNQLEKRWKELEHVHADNRKRNTQALIVLHEELMEEIYDWMEDTEKQIDSIQVDENNVDSLKEEFGRRKELQEDISSFEPQFRNAMAMSNKMITEQYVDPERVESYEKEAASLENRIDRINLKFMDKSQRLSGGVAKYLTSRLDDAEILLTNTEGRIHQEDEGYVDLEFAKQQLDSQKDFMIEVSETQREVSIILDEASAIVEDGYFREPEEGHFRGRIDEIEKRTIAVGENASKEHKRVFDTYLLLLKQHLNRINDWLSRAEARMNTEEEIGTQYENVKQQLEDHQAFQDELRDHSLISTILELDITDPMINQNVRDHVKSMSERWATVWNWGEQRKNQLTAVITNWQKFRDEQLILLNWLASKEKQLKEIGDTNLSDEAEVQEHLHLLRDVEKELDEQGMRLQSLHKAGDDLLKKVDEDEPATREIRIQLNDFDDCWNDIAKQVIDRIQSLETSENKLREYRAELGAVDDWMDSTESLVKGFAVDMDPEEATALQEKVEIKCEEKPKYQVRVDRVNRLGKDLAGSVDKPSFETIEDELKPFNQRWDAISEQLDSYSDTGYPQQDRMCCFARIMRRKFGMFQ